MAITLLQSGAKCALCYEEIELPINEERNSQFAGIQAPQSVTQGDLSSAPHDHTAYCSIQDGIKSVPQLIQRTLFNMVHSSDDREKQYAKLIKQLLSAHTPSGRDQYHLAQHFDLRLFNHPKQSEVINPNPGRQSSRQSNSSGTQHPLLSQSSLESMYSQPDNSFQQHQIKGVNYDEQHKQVVIFLCGKMAHKNCLLHSTPKSNIRTDKSKIGSTSFHFQDKPAANISRLFFCECGNCQQDNIVASRFALLLTPHADRPADYPPLIDPLRYVCQQQQQGMRSENPYGPVGMYDAVTVATTNQNVADNYELLPGQRLALENEQTTSETNIDKVYEGLDHPNQLDEATLSNNVAALVSTIKQTWGWSGDDNSTPTNPPARSPARSPARWQVNADKFPLINIFLALERKYKNLTNGVINENNFSVKIAHPDARTLMCNTKQTALTYTDFITIIDNCYLHNQHRIHDAMVIFDCGCTVSLAYYLQAFAKYCHIYRNSENKQLYVALTCRNHDKPNLNSTLQGRLLKRQAIVIYHNKLLADKDSRQPYDCVVLKNQQADSPVMHQHLQVLATFGTVSANNPGADPLYAELGPGDPKPATVYHMGNRGNIDNTGGAAASSSTFDPRVDLDGPERKAVPNPTYLQMTPVAPNGKSATLTPISSRSTATDEYGTVQPFSDNTDTGRHIRGSEYISAQPRYATREGGTHSAASTDDYAVLNPSAPANAYDNQDHGAPANGEEADYAYDSHTTAADSAPAPQCKETLWVRPLNAVVNQSYVNQAWSLTREERKYISVSRIDNVPGEVMVPLPSNAIQVVQDVVPPPSDGKKYRYAIAGLVAVAGVIGVASAMSGGGGGGGSEPPTPDASCNYNDLDSLTTVYNTLNTTLGTLPGLLNSNTCIQAATVIARVQEHINTVGYTTECIAFANSAINSLATTGLITVGLAQALIDTLTNTRQQCPAPCLSELSDVSPAFNATINAVNMTGYHLTAVNGSVAIVRPNGDRLLGNAGYVSFIGDLLDAIVTYTQRFFPGVQTIDDVANLDAQTDVNINAINATNQMSDICAPQFNVTFGFVNNTVNRIAELAQQSTMVTTTQSTPALITTSAGVTTGTTAALTAAPTRSPTPAPTSVAPSSAAPTVAPTNTIITTTLAPTLAPTVGTTTEPRTRETNPPTPQGG